MMIETTQDETRGTHPAAGRRAEAMMETMRLYHGSLDREAVLRDGFRLGVDSARYHCPWVSTYTEDDRDLAASIGEVIIIDSSALRIMPAELAEEGPADLHAFAEWVRASGYDAFVHPQEAGEIGIVRLDKIRLL